MSRKTELFSEYWNKTNKEALVGVCRGNFFISKRYAASSRLLTESRAVTPEDFAPEVFLNDYERIFEEFESFPHDAVHVAVPFCGLPWIEGMAGCEIRGTGVSFIAKKISSFTTDQGLKVNYNGKWLDLYIKFTEELQKLADGRFPVGQPILRGPCDLIGTMMGQEDFVYELCEEPDNILSLFAEYVDLFNDIAKRQKDVLVPYEGGYGIGFYDMWCPDKCIWFQDDLTSLLSPSLYREYVLPTHIELAKMNDYSLIHLHPISFYMLDDLLAIDELKCIEVNKDQNGLGVNEIIPYLGKIQEAGKVVAFVGDFKSDEIAQIKSALRPQGLYISILDSPEGKK